MKKLILFISILALATGCSQPEIEIFGSISGLVKNSQTSELLSGVRVTLSPGGTSQITAKDGAFSFEELKSGEYSLTFSKDGYEDEISKISVKTGVSSNVQISMTPIRPKLSVTTNALSFGEDATTLSLDISNSGKGILEWEVANNVDWIECSPMSGAVSSKTNTVVVSAKRETLDQGNYSGSFVISSNGGSATILVSISINGITLQVDPAELDFGTITNSLQIKLTNSASGTLAYEATSSNDWLTLNKTSGNITKNDYITAVVSRQGLSAGRYDGSITFSTKKGALAVPVKMEIAVNEKPSVTVEGATNLKYNSATLQGTIVSPGSSKVTKYGFCWSEKANPTTSDFYSNLGDCSEPRAFETSAVNLKSETKYYFRAYAENSVGISYSEETMSFTTLGMPAKPEVSTGDVDEITNSSAKVKGNITSLGNVEKVTQYGHVWSTKQSPTIESASCTKLGEATATYSFVSTLEKLETAQTYYVRAYATNEKGTSYGEEITFKTKTTDPQITTGEVKDIIHDKASCYGEIISTGGHEITEKGICWSVDAKPKITGNHMAATSEGEEYFCRISGLTAETKYYFCAYLKTKEGGVFYGNDGNFTTTKEVKLPQLKNVNVLNITTTGASFECEVISNGNSKITECGFCWSDVSEPTTEDNTIKCDPESSALGKTILSLKEGTKYYVRSFAKNAMGIAYSETATFSTKAVTKPTVGNIRIENVGRTTAYAYAGIIDSGNAEVTEVGFCWSTASNPSTYDNKVKCSTAQNFNTKLTGLPSLSTVYVRAYAINSKGTAYSENISLTTIDTDTDVWDGTIADKFSGGSGTESDPIIISSGAELALLSERVDSGTSFSGVVFKLTSNLNLNDLTWNSIGGTFSGVFDGNGLSITGLNSSGGLFNINSGTIKNTTVKGTIVSSSDYSAGICSKNEGIINGCKSYVNVTGKSYVGGICGRNSGSILNCENHGLVKALGSYIGGISGYIDCVIYLHSSKGYYETASNANFAAIYGSTYVGGIAGYILIENRTTDNGVGNSNLELAVNNCINYGYVTGDNEYGGLIGHIKLVSSSHDLVTYRPGVTSYTSCTDTVTLTISNCCNNSKYGLIGAVEVKTSKYCILAYNDSFWLYDIVNNIGQENAICSESGSGNYYTRTSSACYIRGNTSQDIVALLNKWVSEQSNPSQYYRWKYEVVDGYARPVFDK